MHSMQTLRMHCHGDSELRMHGHAGSKTPAATEV
eukprot:SAG22_NODE_9924_length_563_cov_1.068966_2_plen_33_part_01